MDFRGRKYERGSNWSDPEVAELLQLWSDESVQLELESCLRNQHVFNRIADVLRENGIYRTGDQCREKIKKMKLEYRRIKDNHRMIRGGRSWKFYDVMDRVLTNRPAISYSSLGGTVIAHQVLQSPPSGADAYIHGLPGGAFGSTASGGFLFGHPPRLGELLEIKCEHAESEDGLLNSDAAPPELLYHTGSGDEHDTDGKSAGLDQEDPVEMARGERTTSARFSPSGFSDQNQAGSSGTGASIAGPDGRDTGNQRDPEGSRPAAPVRQRKRRRAGRGAGGGGGGGCGGRGPLDEALVSFLSWQRSAEERLISLEEARLEREAQAEERREQKEERRAEQERQHELRLFSMFTGALAAVRQTAPTSPPFAPTFSTDSTVPSATSGHTAILNALSAPATSSVPFGCPAPTTEPPPSIPARCPTKPESILATLSGAETPGHSVYLSRRGNSIRQHQGILQEGYTQYHADKYQHTDNPNGIINMGTSENKLCYDLLHKRMTQPDMLHIDPALLQYPDWKGHRFLREEVSRFLSHYCGSPRPLRADNVVVMNGCGSLFSSIAAVLCDPEDAILIPTPFYGVITEDMHLYSGVQLFHVHLDCEPSGSGSRPFHLTVDKLEEAMRKAISEGLNVRAVVLVNPHNPLADVYSPQEMTGFLEFAKRHKLHAIVDEVYMLTVFEDTVTFHSVLSMDSLPDPQRTHVMWGMSKDFAMAGVRVGTVYTDNRDLVEALDKLGMFHGVPGPIQHQMAILLQDKDWINGKFLPENRLRMQAAHRYMTGELQSLGVPYLHRPAGFYIWADLRKYLYEPSFVEELSLWRCFLRHKVVLSCGQAFHCSTPGWFRIVFTDRQQHLTLGMQRIRRALEEIDGVTSTLDTGTTNEATEEKGTEKTTQGDTTDAQKPLAVKSTSLSKNRSSEEPEEKDNNIPDAIPLVSEDLILLDCQTSHPAESLDSLIGALRQQIHTSDWLEKNTPELSAGEDPELLDVFKDLLDRARK
ncbi:1-aminocyclopropane-1-carboxylate synthase-like protein 1 [Oncorhynchus keta]|uniref:1-aminocyclopropane-1-carboxylate synthase-like protein 1 n=1 Tax=Oncorhynchus keta TaxID=8018 RepID=UPI0015F9AC4A|nr:1-aminocyclopropane-1-carboxylate synthase-like protein 1 [Oncorhynchus keta]XP_035645541.1 1-aminocyclopropane-1-carboxylate synthase-like protein 1 [Oncorhynchus keta]XP_052321928.1 1-aminocyclopropane-1-carboxylate synthase-like protein 1 [Oncorhynchus keta]